MDKNVIPFVYDNQAIRVIKDEDGNFWWVAKDVCKALTLENTKWAIKNLDEDEKGVTKVDTPGGEQKVIIINEPGLYALILRSNKPEAKIFKRWITHEVLPSLRKTGGYRMNGTDEGGVLCESGVRKTGNMYFPMAKLVEIADKYLEGRAALKALNYFTGMPVEDLLEELEEKREEQERRQAFSNDIDRTVRLFLQHECRFAPEYRTAKTDLYDAYCLFCRDNSMRPLARAAFFRQVYAAAGATGGCYLKTVRPRRNNPGRHGYVNGIKTSAV